ncbi:hypothetical protein V9K67_06570 [Paraflavisolibacter sp. H34]|uniref:hypothetical protein n=1 Tax=Huijunlia imazamoxiresistens TaxID=3127457 RepID=UPI003015F3B6
MKRFLLLLLFPALSLHAQKAYRPEFSIDDLVSFTTYSTNKFDNYLSRKGYKPNGTDSLASVSANTYRKISKDSTIEKIIGLSGENEASSLLYKTTSVAEFNQMKESMKDLGFAAPEGEPLPLYQKANITVQPIISQEGDKTNYSFLIERKVLPKARDIVFAEDLLQLSSHEILTAVFGPQNVRRDVFYFSEKELSRCSVLFPNTSLQVIFLWKDEPNLKNIDFLIIGGSLRSQSSATYYKPIELNKWQSRMGIYSGMSLKDLYLVNGQHLSLYGFESEQAGLISKTSSGNIDFKTIGAQLTCLDCNEDRYYTKNGLINSQDLLRDNRRIYINTLLIFPPKDKKSKEKKNS